MQVSLKILTDAGDQKRKWKVRSKKKNQANNYCYSYENVSNLAPVVQTLDTAIHRINHYPADKY